MLRLILIVVLLLLVVVGGLAVALFQFLGWKGLVVFPFIVLALIWVGRIVIGKLFKHFALRLFSIKSGVLRGAELTVHSVTAVPEPPAEKAEEEEDSNEEEEESGGEGADEEEEGEEEASEEEEEEEEEPEGEKGPKHYYAVELTITPSEKNKEQYWEPGELILTTEKVKALEDLEGKEAGTTREVKVWDGTSYGPDEPGKYPGSQRLKVTFAVKPGTTRAWLHYYNEALGAMDFPKWEPQVECQQEKA